MTKFNRFRTFSHAYGFSRLLSSLCVVAMLFSWSSLLSSGPLRAADEPTDATIAMPSSDNFAKPSTAEPETLTKEASPGKTSNPNAGMTWLDEATEAKLLARNEQDLGGVIALCERAKKAGLVGENLEYCNQLLAATQVQRGLLVGSRLLSFKNPAALPRGWEAVRDRVLADLEEAVTVLKDEPTVYMTIAQLNILPGGDAARASAALEEALRCAKGDAGQYAAIVTFKASLAKTPEEQEKIIAEAVNNNPDIQLMLLHSLSLVNLKNFDGALDVLNKIIDENPKNLTALTAALEILVQTKHLEEALPMLDKLEAALRDDNADAERLHALRQQKMRLLTTLKKFDEAMKLLDEFPETTPREKIAKLSLKTLLLLDLDKKDQALKTNDEAEKLVKELPPETPDLSILKEEVFRQRLHLLATTGRLDEAIDMLKEGNQDGFIKTNMDFTTYYFTLINILEEQEQFDKALQVIDMALENNVAEFSKALLLIQKPRILMAAEKFDEALTIVDDMLKENPDNMEARLLKMQILLEKKDYEPALAILRQLIAENADKVNFQLLEVQILATQKKNQEALKLLEPLLERDNIDKGDLLRMKSQLQIALEQHTEAAKTLEAVINENPDDEVSINNLSWILSTSPVDELRNGDRALALALQACELTEYNEAYILSTLAAAYAELGDFDKAREWSQKSIDKASEDDNVKDRVDDLKKELEFYKQDKPFREPAVDAEPSIADPAAKETMPTEEDATTEKD